MQIQKLDWLHWIMAIGEKIGIVFIWLLWGLFLLAIGIYVLIWFVDNVAFLAFLINLVLKWW